MIWCYQRYKKRWENIVDYIEETMKDFEIDMDCSVDDMFELDEPYEKEENWEYLIQELKRGDNHNEWSDERSKKCRWCSQYVFW